MLTTDRLAEMEVFYAAESVDAMGLAARTDIPDLTADVRRNRALLRESLRLLEAFEWVDVPYSYGRHDPVCPSCEAIQFDGGHTPACPAEAHRVALRKALGASDE